MIAIADAPQPEAIYPFIRVSLRRACRVAFAIVLVLYAAVFLHLTFTLYDRFAYMTFDLGIFDQAVWLISQGKYPFVTTRGLHILGDHFSVLLYLIAPLYRLFPHPKTLLALQTLVVSMGAIPAYALARKRLGSEVYGLLFGLVYLLQPAHQWSMTYEFHPDTFATPLLLAALYALEAKRFRLYAIALLLTVLIKESAGLTVICVGVWASFRYPRMGALTVGFGLLMLAVAMFTVRHFNNGQTSPYFDIFRHFGNSPADIGHHFLRHPISFLGEVFHPGNLFYLSQLLLPLCFLPLLAPEILLLALPMLLVNFMAGRPGMHSIEEYYNAFLTPLLFLGAVIGFDRLQRRGWYLRWIIRLNLPLWAFSGVFTGPLLRPLDTLYTAQPPVAAFAECRIAVTLIPKAASVSAPMALGPYLSHRDCLYALPNPFVPVAYGGTHQALYEIDSVTGALLPDNLSEVLAAFESPQIQYVLLCPHSSPFPLSENNLTRIHVDLLQSRRYETVYVGKYVMVLQRRPQDNVAMERLATQTGLPTHTPKQIEAAYWRWLAAQYPPPKGVTP